MKITVNILYMDIKHAHFVKRNQHSFQMIHINNWCRIRQDRRWNADKPSAALDPYIPTWLTTSPANHRPANFWFFLNIEMKVVQAQVQLMSINIKFEVPILWLFQAQIITNIIY